MEFARETDRILDEALPRTVTLRPFVFMNVQRYAANDIERVMADGRFAARLCSSDEIEVRFRQQILATEPEHVHAEWPATWWDAVKQRFAPRWFLRRWPARIETLDVTRCGLYPEIPWQGRGERRLVLTAIPYMSEHRSGYSRGGDDE